MNIVFLYCIGAQIIASVAFLIVQSSPVMAFHFRFASPRTTTALLFSCCRGRHNNHPFVIPTPRQEQPVRKTYYHHHYHHHHKTSIASNKNNDADTSTINSKAPTLVAIVAPLQYKGPYPCLSLRFPGTGPHAKMPLNFLLDTGANVNAISRRVVKDWNFTEIIDIFPAAKIKEAAAAAAGMGGSLQEGPAVMYMLGDCQLHGMPAGQDEFIFLRNLTAAALPIMQQPDGILGLQFFWSFPAGVEFDWVGTDGDPPTVVFYVGSELPEMAQPSRLHHVVLHALPTQILSLMIQINNSTNTTTDAVTTITELQAVLDTGSPVTVLSRQAAKQAGIETSIDDVTKQQSWKKQPFLKNTIGNDRLVVGGVDGRVVSLSRSVSPVTIQVPCRDTNNHNTSICLGHGHVYVGELPGMAFLGGIPSRKDTTTTARTPSTSSLPSVVLGLDFLKQNIYRMIVSAPKQEMWLEEMHDQLRAATE